MNNVVLEYRKIVNLCTTEALVLDELKKAGEKMDVKDLIKLIDKDRTTIQKALSRLYRLEYVDRRQINLSRGFKLVYFINKEKDIYNVIEKKLKDELQEFYNQVKEFYNK